MLQALDRSGRWSGSAEFVDGGTQGVALLGVLSERPGVVVLDAIGRGGAPGSVYELDRAEALAFEPAGGGTAHEGGAAQLLRLASLTGDLPAWVRVVGVEPAVVRTGLGLSDAVARALPAALERAGLAVGAMLAAAGGRPEDAARA